MIFEQDAGKTWEETIERVLSRSPDLKARVLAVAEVTGQSIQEIVEECAMLWLNDMIEDPAYRAAQHAKEAWQEAPFGRDPLMQKDVC